MNYDKKKNVYACIVIHLYILNTIDKLTISMMIEIRKLIFQPIQVIHFNRPKFK